MDKYEISLEQILLRDFVGFVKCDQWWEEGDVWEKKAYPGAVGSPGIVCISAAKAYLLY